MNVSTTLALVLAQAQAAPDGGSQLVSLGFLLGMSGLVWWFLIARPDQKRRMEHSSFLNSLKAGDEVITAGGIFGKVHSVDKDAVVLEVSKGSKLKVLRDRIRGAAPASDS